VHEEAKKRGEDVNCSHLLGGESDAIVPDMTTTTNSSGPSQFLSKLHLKQYPRENALLSFFLFEATRRSGLQTPKIFQNRIPFVREKGFTIIPSGI
jgi:hypothetical protein